MDASLPKTVIIVGATAVGKTVFALDHCLHHSGEIISADSMQIYRHMDAGTAKPSRQERIRVPHHLIDIVDPDENFSVYNFLEQAQACIEEIRSRDKAPFIVGGTGLYINAYIREFNMPQLAKDDGLRDQLRAFAAVHGTEALYRRLQACDPVACTRIMPNDRYRIVRALEVFELTGRPISSFHQAEKRYRPDIEIWMINRSREDLYSRIEQRVDLMIRDGLIEEVATLLEKGYDTSLPSMQALGYKEVVAYFQGLYTYAQCIAEIKKRTRHFAKRQLTWFKSFPIARVLDF